MDTLPQEALWFVISKNYR